MTQTEADLRMLRALVRSPGSGPQNLGAIVWGRNTIDNYGRNGSAPFARAAGKALNRLGKMGLAEERLVSCGYDRRKRLTFMLRWFPTRAGIRLAEKLA